MASSLIRPLVKCDPDRRIVLCSTDWVSRCVAACANGPGVPLYNSTGPQCSGQPSCNHDIEEQPLNLTTLSDRFAAFAERCAPAICGPHLGILHSWRPSEREVVALPVPSWVCVCVCDGGAGSSRSRRRGQSPSCCTWP